MLWLLLFVTRALHSAAVMPAAPVERRGVIANGVIVKLGLTRASAPPGCVQATSEASIASIFCCTSCLRISRPGQIRYDPPLCPFHNVEKTAGVIAKRVIANLRGSRFLKKVS